MKTVKNLGEIDILKLIFKNFDFTGHKSLQSVKNALFLQN